MFDSYFSSQHQWLIAISFLFLVLSVVVFEFKNKSYVAIALLLIGVCGVKIFMATLSPYLYGWDEAFHGLVAKNLAKDPLTPLLFSKQILHHDYKEWWNSHVWLHKQPFFLWQIALFIKIFGASTFVVRLPSVIWAILSVFMLFKIGENLINERIGFYAALFFSLNNFLNEQLSGAFATDQNDVMFYCLIIASFWAFSEYLLSPQKAHYIVFIGVFAGFAVLTKWLSGLLIYLSWFTYILLSNERNILKLKSYFDMIKSFLVSVIIFLPWQIYILWKFPAESRFEYEFNSRHLTEVIEHHSGTNYFYYEILPKQYGYLSALFVLMGLLVLRKYFKNKKLYYSFIISLLFVYALFTYAQTKMAGFTMMVCFMVFLGFGALTQSLKDYFESNSIAGKLLLITSTCFMAFSTFNLEAIQEVHTRWKMVDKNLFYLEKEEDLSETTKLVNNTIKDTSYVFFNCGFPNHIRFMFETGFIAYPGLPESWTEFELSKKGYKVAVLDNGILPNNILNNPKYFIVGIPKNTIKCVDTVYVSNIYGYLGNNNGTFSIKPDKEKLILTTYADSSCNIKTQEGKLAMIAFDRGKEIRFEGQYLLIHERFKLHIGSDSAIKFQTFQKQFLKYDNATGNIISANFEENNFFDFHVEKANSLR